MTPLLTARGLRIDRRLSPTDLHVGAGELVALIGPNGSGKTSLLRCIADIEGAADLLEICGEALKASAPARRPHLLTFLPASRETVWPISVGDLIALGLPSPDPLRVAHLLELLDLERFQYRPVNSLSTGEKTRVLLARALASKPSLLLLDEPLSNLDPYWALRLLEVLRDDIGETSSALVALHDLNQLETFDRVVLIDGGRLLLDGPAAQVLDSPELRQSFGVERRSSRWAIRRTENPQSSR